MCYPKRVWFFWVFFLLLLPEYTTTKTFSNSCTLSLYICVCVCVCVCICVWVSPLPYTVYELAYLLFKNGHSSVALST